MTGENGGVVGREHKRKSKGNRNAGHIKVCTF